MILAGDIGGTNTRLAIFDDQQKPLTEAHKFSTGNGHQLEAQIGQVLEKFGQKVDRACIAVAGPVIEGVCRSTNIGRTFVAEEIGKTIGFKSFTLINDLVGNASGIELLGEEEFVTLLPGEGRMGSRAVVSPGTGLGEGLLIYDGQYHRAFPSEGGHSRFAPTTPDEAGLLAFMQKKQGDVIVEHIMSGRGIGNIFDYYVSTGRKPADSVLAELAKVDHIGRGGVISKAALGHACDVCKSTMELFVHALAIESASMAVKSFAIGGIYIGGGIPPKILPLLKTEAFAKAFTTHVTMGEFLKRVPVRVILNDDTALEGAALYGKRFG
ncbi:MAG: glucokinase [Phycisphaerales bacterium]|nr:glucokinase [Phycisphaerales bacterium]